MKVKEENQLDLFDRKVFYVDVGQLPKSEVEAYLAQILYEYKNRIKLPNKGILIA